MYAVFQNGGKQYQVTEGQTIQIEKLPTKIGEKITFNTIMIIVDTNNIQIGNPFIKNKTIEAETISHNKNKKIKIIKFKRRKHFRKTQGHRQWFTNIKIININNN
ncbi:50S ribosomal protein L21 [Blochmannia endosymbiont of Camponotus (Colobopsis) obliquus]|uniref:50S ribosomal protein L21 n=1 Tax=Blochmannia endosymbiont of Camponotus (Colobopsis) obliquus TaxID=1505597 RepID=UPI00061A5E75|nr:50S ribosomal protein L21 [Blochmannia endosymbiont of Camponotus (Colobopsis) obliquus]AKC60270.1 50S ribosomal protein L21 [Blochmannia endosymbiont of Camponotus (Colobopsis) obliquus]